MPFVDIIYEKADDETKKNLKLASKAFWECHIQEKYEKNYAKSQEKRHWQLYCYGDCPETDNFEVIFSVYIFLYQKITVHFKACFQPPLYTTNRGEICAPDEPRTRDGWLINLPFNWTKPEPSKQVRKWTGCRKCWEKFCTENPEYKISL